jgi:hypothetical protein
MGHLQGEDFSWGLSAYYSVHKTKGGIGIPPSDIN